MKVFSSYFDSEWSFAQFKVSDRRSKLAFGADTNSIYIIGHDGNFSMVNFDPVNGGECLKQFEGKVFDAGK
jgi:hypothetical protein